MLLAVCGAADVGIPRAEAEPPEESDDLRDEARRRQAIPVAFRHRKRRGNLRAEGGLGTQRAVDLGLEWLERHQSPEGHWDCDGFHARCRPDTCGGAGGAGFDPGVTGLALLAFLGVGETHRAGPHLRTVDKGFEYLRRIQQPDGCFGPRTTGHFVYNHAIATYAMVEAYALTGSPRLELSAQKAIDFIEDCRNPYLAWRYGVRPQDNDTSVTSWMVAALWAARSTGKLQVPKEAFEGTRVWLDKVTEPEYGKVGYTARGTGPCRLAERKDRFPADRSESLTAAGILCRIFTGAVPRTNEMIRKGARLCLRRRPEWDESSGSIDMVYWYFGSLALFQVGGETWKAWNLPLRKALLEHQCTTGDRRGSWNPVGVWGPEGGRVYSTAMGVLCLETYYRYIRLYSPVR